MLSPAKRVRADLKGVPQQAYGRREFIEAHLPPPPADVLEIGCGEGELARVVARLGYRIVAIDPRAPEGDIFERVSLQAFAGRSPFDAVLANRALHHTPI
jgi:cyclopropane fatty-acyl-phospholipid synthase-like methyltransferase